MTKPERFFVTELRAEASQVSVRQSRVALAVALEAQRSGLAKETTAEELAGRIAAKLAAKQKAAEFP